MESIAGPAHWVGFSLFVLGMLALDLGVFHKKPHDVSLREAGIWSGLWVALAGGFGLGLYHFYGPTRALEFATGYVIEKALSVDNIFVFVVLFAALAIPAALQHRVLFWGILGALLMRGAFIALGAALLEHFSWVLYVFGAILLFTGAKLFFSRSDIAPDPADSRVLRALRRVVPTSLEPAGSKFFVRKGGRWLATPLFGGLVLVESTDLIFAVDSIPAIFAVTRDPFIVYTSNVFAILGLRSLYFVLAGVMDKFRYLKPALALILVFIGVKLVLAHVAPIPIGIALGAIALVLAAAVALSLVRPRDPRAT